VPGEGVPSPGVLANWIARGLVVQLGHRCPRVKRDGTAGLVGCPIRWPPRAAPPSRRGRPPASIALDRDYGKDAGRSFVAMPVTIPGRCARML
jgi:hypothetical protein